MSEQITLGFKGHDKDLKCRDFQYEIGIEAEMDKDKTLNVCPSNDTEGGLHFCKNPLDVFLYYKPTNGNRFTLVEGIGEAMTHSGDSKVAVRKLKIIKELSLKDIISESVKCIINNSITATSGDYSTAATSGYRLTAATSGDKSTAATSGYYSTAATTGDYSTAATSGDYSTAATSGQYSTAATSGVISTAATSGGNSTAATSGDYSVALTNGINSISNVNGKNSIALSCNDFSYCTVNGNLNIAIVCGKHSKAKGVFGSWLILTDVINDERILISVKVDNIKIKENIYYKLINGIIEESL